MVLGVTFKHLFNTGLILCPLHLVRVEIFLNAPSSGLTINFLSSCSHLFTAFRASVGAQIHRWDTLRCKCCAQKYKTPQMQHCAEILCKQSMQFVFLVIYTIKSREVIVQDAKQTSKQEVFLTIRISCRL